MVSELSKAPNLDLMDTSAASKEENAIPTSGSILTMESSKAKSKLPMKYNINSVFRTPMDKLDFTCWKSQFETVLDLHDLTQVVTDDPPTMASSEEDGNQEYEEWRRVDRLVMTWIKFTVSTAVQQMIVSCKTAKEAWNRMEKFLSPLCVIHVKSLRNKLRTAKKAPTTSMIDYLVSMRTTVDTLATAGAPVPDEELVGYTLDGLDYNFIRIQSTLQMTNDIVFDELITLLIREEDLIHRHQPPETPARSTLFY